MARLTGLSRRLYQLARPFPTAEQTPVRRGRGPLKLVIILDGTMSSLEPGEETNAGLAYRLLSEVPGVAVYYEAGLQWHDWRATRDVMLGRGINRQIRRAYGWLASRYHPGDQVFLVGYSRGAFAVRSLSGVIDRVGLLRGDEATERNIQTAYRHYQAGEEGDIQEAFAKAYCHKRVEINGVFVWDTVKALGFRVPLLWRWMAETHAFHDHAIGPSILAGFQALAADETRLAFEPVLWTTGEETKARVEQLWFPGTLGDIGGQLGGFQPARKLSNLAFVWMMEKLEECGLSLPAGWQARYPVDFHAPSVGTWGGTGKLFLLRSQRQIGNDSSDKIHEAVAFRIARPRRRVWRVWRARRSL